MWSDFSLFSTCWRRRDEIFERRFGVDASQAARTPLPKVVLHSALALLAKQAPRLPTRTRHDRDAGKFLVRVLWTVSTSKSLHNPDNFAAFLESCGDEGLIHQM